jgi:hypothetical protein
MLLITSQQVWKRRHLSALGKNGDGQVGGHQAALVQVVSFFTCWATLIAMESNNVNK